MTRETRLLLIIVVLSAAVLWVLSRLRFPEGSPGAPHATAPLPLERLAARATYDELATIIADLGDRVTPSVSVLRLDVNGVQRFVPAVRVRPDLLLAHVMPDNRILAIVGSDALVDVAAYDESRQLVLLRVPADASRVASLDDAEGSSSAPRYVAAVEGTRGGPALRPVFVGRTDPFSDSRYAGQLFVLGGVLQASPGSLIFGLDGSFAGLCIMDEGFAAGVPGRALDIAIAEMLRPR